MKRTKAAFTLVELLVVLLLMGIIYALAFNYMMPKNGKETASDLTLRTITSFFRSDALYGKKDLVLYCMDDGDCLLASGGRAQQTDIKLRHSGIAYIITPDETLQTVEYPHIKIGTEEFKPRFSIHCRADGLFDPQIVREGDTWFYIHPFGEVYPFSDPVSMVSFVRRSDYLPDQAGYAQ